ncbi:MAG TPA: VIT and VWA domain-containing protein, partial [Tepidisphaeraceae bacterium]|nr:VIT and VWA domain-containing protein [Tepidisphaeraceae bacterium]
MRQRFTFAAGALAAVVCFFLSPARGAGLMVSDTGNLLDIEQHDVRVTINNGIAVTRVTQVFRNAEPQTVEALYTFPVPANASVAGFTMWINGREMIGEAVEKRAAREIYAHAKSENHSPGILEQSDYRTFELRIFPIPANGTQKIQVTYYQEIDGDGQWTTYVYPLASNARQIVNSRVSKSFSLTADIKSMSTIAEVRSASHPATMQSTRFAPTYARATISAASASLDRDVVLTFRTENTETGARLLASTPAGSDGFFCLMLNAGPELQPADVGMDYVFLLDISGSMRDDDKIGQSRGTLGALVEMLGKSDRFDVMAFNTDSTAAFGQLNDADDSHKAAAAEFLNSRRARGGT